MSGSHLSSQDEEHHHHPSSSKSMGDRFAENMKDQYSNTVDARHALEDSRVEAARVAVSKQVNKLKSWIKKIGVRQSNNNNNNHLSCTYGALFDAVQGDMPTLSGTLKTARRLGVVQYEGETLFQGASNHVVIVLLDESDDHPYDVVVSEKGSVKKKKDEDDVDEKDPFALDARVAQSAPCFRCHKVVSPTERVAVSGKVMHRSCFECFLPACTIPLTAARYGSAEVDGEMRFYCIAHYKQLFNVHADYGKGFQDAPQKKPQQEEQEK